jgi:hypothetical protein
MPSPSIVVLTDERTIKGHPQRTKDGQMTLSIKRDDAREDRVDPMWSTNNDERRIAIVRRAAAGARKALAAR